MSSEKLLAVANELAESSCRPNRHTIGLESGDTAKAARVLFVIDPQPEEEPPTGGDDEVLVALELSTALRECTSEATEFSSSSWVEAHINGRVSFRYRRDPY
jgi:hypothetical protein